MLRFKNPIDFSLIGTRRVAVACTIETEPTLSKLAYKTMIHPQAKFHRNLLSKLCHAFKDNFPQWARMKRKLSLLSINSIGEEGKKQNETRWTAK